MNADESPAERRRRAMLEDAEAGDAETEAERAPDIPVDVVVEVERLTRLARNAEERVERTGPMGETLDSPDEPTFYLDKRDSLLAAYGYTSRLREKDDTLVLYPEEWVEDDTVQFDRIDDTDRAVECSLSGPGDEDDWADVEASNASLVASVKTEYGVEHAANARAFADFMGNHYAKEVERATGAEVREFLRDYYPRNAWPSEAETSLVEESVRKMFEAAGVEPPAF